jgi:hypothetical protein
VAARIPDQLISIKISALINPKLLQKFDRAVMLRDRIWKDFSVGGKMTAQALFNAVQKIYAGLTTKDVSSYLKSIHNFNG